MKRSRVYIIGFLILLVGVVAFNDFSEGEGRGNLWSTKAIKALEQLINSDGEVDLSGVVDTLAPADLPGVLGPVAGCNGKYFQYDETNDVLDCVPTPTAPDGSITRVKLDTTTASVKRLCSDPAAVIDYSDANWTEVCIDPDDGTEHAYYGGATHQIGCNTLYLPKSIVIESPVDADRLVVMRANAAWTVTGINCIVDPANSGESVVIALYESDGSGDFTDLATNGLDGTTTITCDNDGAADDGTLSNPSIDSGDWIGIDVGTVTGTVSTLTITFAVTQ